MTTEKETRDAMAIFHLTKDRVTQAHIDFVRCHNEKVEHYQQSIDRLKENIKTWEAVK